MTKAHEAKYEAVIKDQREGLFKDTFGKLAEVMDLINDLNKRQFGVQDTLEKYTFERKVLNVTVNEQNKKCEEYKVLYAKFEELEQMHKELKSDFEKIPKGK